LVEISLESGEIINEYPTDDAEFLNDIDIDDKGNVYVSDMTSDRIFRLSESTFELWLQAPEFENPNGLFVKDKDLLVGVKGRILSVNTETKEIKTFIENTGGIDGLETLNNDQYVFSDWSGHINIASPGKSVKLILNTAKDTIQAADIDYCPEKDLILVPTFFHNTVSAYEVVRK
jgi:sugar lactone lactonase YvrE